MSIPIKLAEKLSRDPYYFQCVITGKSPVQWHHVFTFSGKSIQEPWNIVPVTKEIHDQCTQHKSEYNREMAERVELIALSRATNEELLEYSKVIDLIEIRDRLKKKYG